MKVLAINAGSSSLKYQLIDFDTKTVLAKGLCERIGIDGHLVHRKGEDGDKQEFDIAMPTHREALQSVFNALTDSETGVIASLSEVNAAGHRVAHGGNFPTSVLVTPESMARLEELIELAPLHNGPEVNCIKVCADLMGPDVPQVAVFDTSFHQTMPEEAFLYALPYEYYENYAVRRYGFHGTSHRYVANRAAEMMGKKLEDLKIVTCHLGNGSSVTAVDGGKSIDTSMGFTPGAGLPMGTRCGDIDPFIVNFLANKLELTGTEVDEVLNKKSGMLGMSGVSSDFRDVEAAANDGSKRAQAALDVFCYQVTKLIGAYATAMGGVDAIVFTAGVGENDSYVREQACKRLAFLGAKINTEVNNATHGAEAVISTDDSTLKVMVIPTNEEIMIASDTVAIANGETLA